MTRDVDIAFQAPGKLRDLWGVVEGEGSLIVPDTRLICNIMKVLVWTGPGWDRCRVGVRVEVDLIESGESFFYEWVWFVGADGGVCIGGFGCGMEVWGRGGFLDRVS